VAGVCVAEAILVLLHCHQLLKDSGTSAFFPWGFNDAFSVNDTS
jgi:hypothetical protein